MTDHTQVVERRMSIPGCRLVEEIGRGGMGVVWRAERADGWCVVKILRAAADEHPVVTRRFMREAQITALLDHPGIARVLDAGIANNRPYITAENIHGQTLSDLARDARCAGLTIPLPIVIGIAVQTLRALHYAHEFVGPEGPLGLVHRDLSPQNVMVRFDGRVCVIDFGIARSASADALTKSGMLLGTPGYMAPEQARALPVDRRADVYAFGVALYEIFTGERLVRGSSILEMLRSVERDVPAPIESLNDELPAGFTAVFETALQKDPQARFADARAFEEALVAVSPRTADEDAIAEFLARLYDEATRRPRAMTFGMPDYPVGDATRSEFVAPAAPLGPAPVLAKRPHFGLAAALLITASVGLLFAVLQLSPATDPVANASSAAPSANPANAPAASGANAPMANAPSANAPNANAANADTPTANAKAATADTKAPSASQPSAKASPVPPPRVEPTPSAQAQAESKTAGTKPASSRTRATKRQRTPPPHPIERVQRKPATPSSLLARAVRLHRADPPAEARRELERLIARLTLVENGDPTESEILALATDLERIESSLLR